MTKKRRKLTELEKVLVARGGMIHSYRKSKGARPIKGRSRGD